MSNLPPGCTISDIDISAGEYKVECERCGEIVLANEITEHGYCYKCEEQEQEQPRDRHEDNEQ